MQDQTLPAEPIEATAYGRAAPSYNGALAEVGAGTPGGEYLRRYWHPVAVSDELTTTPHKLKILGEDLVVFRDGNGRPGLLHPRCAHRGSSLYYGRVEAEGIRCCYHGWLFDTRGHCLDQPCEPDGGARKHQVRQPWYPVEERYGLVFAYMGPPDRKPALPRYDIFEDLPNDVILYARCDPGASGYTDSSVETDAIPYNWLQFWENNVDPYHVWVLHSTFSDFAQFAQELRERPRVEFENGGNSILYHAYRTAGARRMDRIGQCILPNINAIASVQLMEGPTETLGWTVPIDDTSFTCFHVSAQRERMGQFDAIAMTPDGKTWSQMTEAEHQCYPGDFEAQSSQGAITLHSEENLAQSDLGIVMLRRVMAQQIKAVADGKDPVGVSFTEDRALIRVAAGNFYLDQ
jgi:phenylpropionate dioxygenase-like ring-hydroxylating dioxygenase large terminal subunit